VKIGTISWWLRNSNGCWNIWSWISRLFPFRSYIITRNILGLWSIKSYNPETTKIFNSSIFDKDLIGLDLEEFNNSFTNLILAVLIHFKKTKIEKIKDIIFLLMIFWLCWARGTFLSGMREPMNFNKFFQDRLSYFENNESFNIIKDRVLLTYEHLI